MCSEKVILLHDFWFVLLSLNHTFLPLFSWLPVLDSTLQSAIKQIKSNKSWIT